jgi:hypothetical protein
MRVGSTRFKGYFQPCYAAYARSHGDATYYTFDVLLP